MYVYSTHTYMYHIQSYTLYCNHECITYYCMSCTCIQHWIQDLHVIIYMLPWLPVSTFHYSNQIEARQDFRLCSAWEDQNNQILVHTCRHQDD
jgi:hypothetical protein